MSFSFSFGTCYRDGCHCRAFEQGPEKRQCVCGHGVCFHAASTHGCSSLTTSTPANHGSNDADRTTKKREIPVHLKKLSRFLQALYEEGHFHQLQYSPNLSSLTDLVMARYLQASQKQRSSVEATLSLIDALWSSQVRNHCIYQSFPNERERKLAFMELDRMASRAIHVFRGTRPKQLNLVAAGYFLANCDEAMSLIRSKIPQWADDNLPPESLRDYILEQERNRQQQRHFF